MRGDFRNRAATKSGRDKAEQPAVLFERDGGKSFAFSFGQKFVCHGFERVGSGNVGGDLVLLGLFARINAICDQPPRCISLGARVG